MKDRSGVAITKEGDTVGHVLYNFRLLLSNFLKRECNKGFMECLKFPTLLYGRQAYIQRIQKVIQLSLDKGLLYCTCMQSKFSS